MKYAGRRKPERMEKIKGGGKKERNIQKVLQNWVGRAQSYIQENAKSN